MLAAGGMCLTQQQRGIYLGNMQHLSHFTLDIQFMKNKSILSLATSMFKSHSHKAEGLLL